MTLSILGDAGGKQPLAQPVLQSLEQVGWLSILRSCCVSRADPGGLLTAGPPGL